MKLAIELVMKLATKKKPKKKNQKKKNQKRKTRSRGFGLKIKISTAVDKKMPPLRGAKDLFFRLFKFSRIFQRIQKLITGVNINLLSLPIFAEFIH